MRALLTDLDRTLTNEDLSPQTEALDAIGQLRAAGTRVVLVTGRDLDDIHGIGERVDAVVAENGGIVHARPAAPELADGAFVERARTALGDAADIVVWRRVVGSAPRVMAGEIGGALRIAGIAHKLEWNADEVMILPPGVDKGSGARRALDILGIEPKDAMAVGDGENDVAMFQAVGRSFAVANAPDVVRAAASATTSGAYADGFVEAARLLLKEVRP